jgi:hypothetical protein
MRGLDPLIHPLDKGGSPGTGEGKRRRASFTLGKWLDR